MMGLSLTMIAILGLGVYQAFRYFSGSSPAKLDPKTLIISLLGSNSASQTITNILGTKFSKFNLSVGEKKPDVKSGDDDFVPEGNPILKFALVADSHNDNESLAKALSQAKQAGASFVIGLGDFSDTGTLDELQKAKDVFEASGLPFYLTAGDHDLWAARDKGLNAAANFSEVFDSPYQTFRSSNIQFVIVYNSDNYRGLDGVERQWLEDTLQKAQENKPKAILVFLHEPLYHPTSDHFMGSPRKGEEQQNNQEIINQAKELIKLFKDNNVAGVIAGDTHAFLRYRDPDTGLKLTTTGAVTRERNAEPPKFAVVDVYQDGSYNISDIEIK
ncbi:metallophosphoesterase [Candidatus Daviesbacteria bacterium]|nr:metallophosphoesterase [Candidatus Daviesbacteria bacterium]